MRTLLSIAGIVLTTQLSSAALPPAAPIRTAAELRAAASAAPVARIEFTLPDKASAAEAALAGRFFNQPEEHRYSGMTTADWNAKWQLFSEALVANAKSKNLDWLSLEQCLRALNRGRNRQTMLWPLPVQDEFPDRTTPKAELEARRRNAEENYSAALRDRNAHPEKWYNENQAIVPVGAYFARHAQGECWIVVCKWETTSQEEEMPLGHIMIWAIDTKSSAVVGYVTCD